MAKYADDVRSDNTLIPMDGVSSSRPVGRVQKQGMRKANDASRTPKQLSKLRRKSQMRMRLR